MEERGNAPLFLLVTKGPFGVFFILSKKCYKEGERKQKER